jgi:hypothetical protein
LDSEKFKILSRDIIRIYSLKNQTFENSLNTIKLDSEKFKILSRDIIRIYSLKNQIFEKKSNKARLKMNQVTQRLAQSIMNLEEYQSNLIHARSGEYIGSTSSVGVGRDARNCGDGSGGSGHVDGGSGSGGIDGIGRSGNKEGGGHSIPGFWEECVVAISHEESQLAANFYNDSSCVLVRRS